jgi:hypothetical protein
LIASLYRSPLVTYVWFLVCSNNDLHAMAPQTHRHNDVALPTIGEQHETDISLESDVDYKAWKPDRNVKMALAVQTFCVVR